MEEIQTTQQPVSEDTTEHKVPSVVEEAIKTVVADAIKRAGSASRYTYQFRNVKHEGLDLGNFQITVEKTS